MPGLRTRAYVFISTRQPKKVLRAVRRIRGVVHADAIFGSPDVIAIVAGRDVADMDAVIDTASQSCGSSPPQTQRLRGGSTVSNCHSWLRPSAGHISDKGDGRSSVRAGVQAERGEAHGGVHGVSKVRRARSGLLDQASLQKPTLPVMPIRQRRAI